MLGATPRTPAADLFDQADTPEASAAARALSVPRTRLAAEVAFLPGASDRAGALLDDLRAGRRPATAGLPPLATANLLAHLCATGAATEADLAELVRVMPAGPDEELAAAIDADRSMAGMPPCQRPALAAELDALTDDHAGSLAAACAARPDGAERLSAILDAGPGRPTAFLRRTASSWTRRTAADLADAEAAANAAAAAWRGLPDSARLADLDGTVRRWAALSRPQRLVDAKAALDHPPTLRVLGSWRGSMRRVAETGGGALPVAELLADLFRDLPGESAALADEMRQLAARGEEQALAPSLQHLETVVGRLSADVLPLRACLATRPFGPGSRKEALALWEAFDAVAGASASSEVAWTVVLRLAPLIDAPPRPGRARAVASFYDGLIRRAEAQGRTVLAARLRATLREREANAAIERYEARKRSWRWLPWWLAPVRDPALGALARHALRLVDNPERRRALEAEHLQRRRRTRRFRLAALFLLVGGSVLAAVSEADSDYAATAPYRRHAPISLTPGHSFDFPAHVGEQEPDEGTRSLARAEVRWCLFNLARLRGAQLSVTTDDTALRWLSVELTSRCKDRSAQQLDVEAAQADVAHNQDRLMHEGRALLKTSTP